MSLKVEKGSKQRSRKRCKARTKAGSGCQAPAVERGLCFFHAHPEKLSELGRQGGQKNRRSKVDEYNLATIPLKSTADVIELLEETINRVRKGPFDPRAANTIGFLSGTLLKAFAQHLVAPRENQDSPNVYQSIFERQAADRSKPTLALGPLPTEEIRPLFPHLARQPDINPTNCPLPPPGELIDEALGESLDDPPDLPSDQPREITVEIDP
jgi:hypothetical protein